MRLSFVLRLVAVAALACVPNGAPTERDTRGMSASRLRRAAATIERAVDARALAGAVTYVARHGHVVHFEAVGELDVERHVPMPKDAIFRIASMTKAVTTVAVMMLVEEGKVALDDRVSKHVASFARTTVLGEGGAVPAKREITIRDLLTHTSGLSYGAGALKSQYEASHVLGWYFADEDETIDFAIDRIASLPFQAQPGEAWVYGFSTDVLGVVVERASGMSLDAFFRARILEPLGMLDTSFYLPPEKAPRLATVYSKKRGEPLVRAPDAGQIGQGAYVNGPRKAFSGGAGLLATTRDYARFLQMLANGGELDGVRLLAPESVALMTKNHVGNLYREGRFGFGFGFEIVEDVGRAKRAASPGEYGWGGAYYTDYFVDPVEEIVGVAMAQLIPADDVMVFDDFRAAVHKAIAASWARE